MWGHQAMDSGFSALKGITSFVTANREAKARKAWQKYNNAMVNIGNALSQNSITTNQVNAVQTDRTVYGQIEQSRMTTVARAEVAAAVADTTGRSVNQTVEQIGRNADEAQAARQLQLEQQIEGFKVQRQNANYQATVQQDRSDIRAPNPLSAALGAAVDLGKVAQRWSPNSI